uniref:28S ribosomal protein S24, mitochondrial n=1 Tax=Setaria digitata TaxID=48799 RepID=A0A915Q2B9_9BILA
MVLAKTSCQNVADIVMLERFLSTSCIRWKNTAGKYRTTTGRKQMLTYEMAHRPHHIGVKKSWLTWHSQNLETFRQRQPVVGNAKAIATLQNLKPKASSLKKILQMAQDEIIRRFVRGFFPDYITVDGSELVIKRQGNCVRVTGFFHYQNRLNIREIYWMFGFTEEFLSVLLKQPVKLEIQFVAEEKDLAYNYI